MFHHSRVGEKPLRRRIDPVFSNVAWHEEVLQNRHHQHAPPAWGTTEDSLTMKSLEQSSQAYSPEGNPFATALVDMASISTLWLVSATPVFELAATGGVQHPGG